MYYGILKANTQATLLERYTVVQTNTQSNRIAARIRLTLEKQGTPIGASDVLIAASVLAEDGILVTKDKHFSHIPGLVCEIIT